METSTCANCGKSIKLRMADNNFGGKFWWYAAVGEMKNAYVCSEDGMKWEPHRAGVSA